MDGDQCSMSHSWMLGQTAILCVLLSRHLMPAKQPQAPMHLAPATSDSYYQSMLIAAEARRSQPRIVKCNYQPVLTHATQ